MWLSALQDWHTRHAAVTSTANTSCSSPAIAFPSVCSEPASISVSSRSEALGVDTRRLVAELHEQPRRLLDEGRRPAHVHAWPLGRRRPESGEHVAVDAAGEALPARRRMLAGERDAHVDGVARGRLRRSAVARPLLEAVPVE